LLAGGVFRSSCEAAATASKGENVFPFPVSNMISAQPPSLLMRGAASANGGSRFFLVQAQLQKKVKK
jgi:hypothetical protein